MKRILGRRSLRIVLILAALFLIGGSILRFAAVGATPDVSGLAVRATGITQHYATQRVGLPPEKQDILDRQATRDARIALTPSHAPPSPIPYDTPVPAYGIFQARTNPYNRAQPAANQWYGIVNGRGIGVWAGMKYDDQNQGVVDVALENPGGAKDTYTEYLTPRKAGSVRIIDVTGTRVSLLAKDGATFVFDLQTMSFV